MQVVCPLAVQSGGTGNSRQEEDHYSEQEVDLRKPHRSVDKTGVFIRLGVGVYGLKEQGSRQSRLKDPGLNDGKGDHHDDGDVLNKDSKRPRVIK